MTESLALDIAMIACLILMGIYVVYIGYDTWNYRQYQKRRDKLNEHDNNAGSNRNGRSSDGKRKVD